LIRGAEFRDDEVSIREVDVAPGVKGLVATATKRLLRAAAQDSEEALRGRERAPSETWPRMIGAEM